MAFVKVYPWWRHKMETFSALLALCAGYSPVPVNSPHKGQWRGALIFSFICAWIYDWVNNREAGDLRRHRGHYDVNAMRWLCLSDRKAMTPCDQYNWTRSLNLELVVQVIAPRLFGEPVKIEQAIFKLSVYPMNYDTVRYVAFVIWYTPIYP